MEYSGEEKQIIDIFSKNISYLMENGKEKQEFYASQFGISPSMLSDYKHGRYCPNNIKMLRKIAKCFNTSIDDLINCDLSKRDKEYEEESKLYNPYIDNNILLFGSSLYDKFLYKNFWLYSFKTGERDPVTINELRFNIEVNEKNNSYIVYLEMTKSGYLYDGNLVLTRDTIYIYLRGKSHNERALIILNLPQVFSRKLNKDYIGGVGLIVSLSKGNKVVPCMQKVLISDICIPIENCKEELINLLSFDENNSRIIRLDYKDEIIAYDFIKKFRNI